MSEPITMSPDNTTETTLWIGTYRDAMRMAVEHKLDLRDFPGTAPEFAATAADLAVLEFRKRTTRERLVAPDLDTARRDVADDTERVQMGLTNPSTEG